MTATPLDWTLHLLLLQGLLGALDTIYHHELTVALPSQPSAQRELRIHALRALLYGLLFAGMAWGEFHGAWVLAVGGLVAVEVGLTLWDFVVEDHSRKLPASERVLHTVLAINGGALFGLYAWQLAQWLQLPTALLWVDRGWISWVLSVLALGVAISGVRDGLAARTLGRAQATAQPVANPFLALAPQQVLVTGGTGFIGEALVQQLLAAGHGVSLLTRDPLRAAYRFQGRAACLHSLDELSGRERFDAVINLAGAPVVGPPWSARRKAQLLASRVGTTHSLLHWLARAGHKPAVWVQASAIGYYGVRPPGERLSEDSAPGTGFMSELCREWESCADQARASGVRQVVLRLGLVFGPGGALPALLRPYRLGCGGRLGHGQQIMSWIHREDVLHLIARSLADGHMAGVYNAVAPEAVTQAEFARTAGHLLHRPVWLHLPAEPLRALLGEMAQLFVDGQQVYPARLLAESYRFRHPALKQALENLL